MYIAVCGRDWLIYCLKQERVRHERKAITAKRINTITSIYDLNTQAYKFNSTIMTSDFQITQWLEKSLFHNRRNSTIADLAVLSSMHNYFHACFFSDAGSLIALSDTFAHHLAQLAIIK